MSDRIITGSADIQTTGGINFSDIFKKNKENPVGSITKSVLSQAQFQSKAGDGWILVNGASLSTSTYPELFAAIGYTYGGSGGNFNIPNMQDRYTRMSGSYAVGTCQSNTTAITGLSLSAGSASFSGTNSFSPPGAHEHGVGTLSSPIWFDYNKIDHNGTGQVSGPNISFPNNACILVRGISNITVYRNYVNLRGYSSKNMTGTNTYRVSTTSLPSLSSIDTETRPSTVVLNWFMRVK